MDKLLKPQGSPLRRLAVVAATGLLIFLLGWVLINLIRSVGSSEPPHTNASKLDIQALIANAKPGDTISLPAGQYWQDIIVDKPLTIEGPSAAVFRGSGSDRIIEIRSSNVTLRGFSIDGQATPGKAKNSWKSVTNVYRDKLIYIQSLQAQKNGLALSGVTLENLSLQNAGGECVRLKYFAVENKIINNHIKNCGGYAFDFNTRQLRGLKKPGESNINKNGEAIYIGTSNNDAQLTKNPTPEIDLTHDNLVSNNTIETNGNECVDLKEGTFANTIAHNDCSRQLDPESGGMESRGNQNIFRFNDIHDVTGAAIRLGGDSGGASRGGQNKLFGINNEIYGNDFQNIGYQHDIKITIKQEATEIYNQPQKLICGNQGSQSLIDEQHTGSFVLTDCPASIELENPGPS